MSLKPCSACARPVRAADLACPFCAAALEVAGPKPFVRARLLGGAVAIAMTTGCPAAQPVYGVAGTPSAAPASTMPMPSERPSASPAPSASPSPKG